MLEQVGLTLCLRRQKNLHEELERLCLDIVDMKIGLSLRAANTAGNHYPGTVRRL